MTNRIRDIQILQDLSDPTEPVIWIGVTPEFETAGTELKGRLMGPRCRYSSTVEVAYPLLAAPRIPKGWPGLARRVIIPEACLWDPVSPFLYQGPVELWQEGQCCDQRAISMGLRAFQLGSLGLRVNGRVFTIKAMERNSLTEPEALQLRKQGYNTLVVPANEAIDSLWQFANQVGFFVICQVAQGWLQQAAAWRHHPSLLGCVLPLQAFASVKESNVILSSGYYLGVELDPRATPPKGAHFIYQKNTEPTIRWLS